MDSANVGKKPVTPPNPQAVKRKGQGPEAEAVVKEEATVEPQDQSTVGQPPADPPKADGKDHSNVGQDMGPTVELGARFDVPQKIFEGPPDEKGVQTTTHTIGLVPYANMDEAKKAGVIIPEIHEVKSKAGLGPRGHLEIMTLQDTNNPETVAIAVPMEIPADSQYVDPATGRAPIQDMEARLVPRDADIIPKFHHAELSTSKASRKIEVGANVFEKVSDFAGNITQSSMAGIMWEFPVAPFVSAVAAPVIGVKSVRDWANVAKRMSYVDNVRADSKSDMIEIYENGMKVPVSATEETKRLANQALSAKTKLASAGFLGAAGTIGTLSLFKAGALGATATGAIAAAAPFVPALATAGMVATGSAMGINAGKELVHLAKEKKELLALQEQLRAEGKPEVIRKTVEVPHQKLGRMVAINEVDMPIEKRLDEISAAQKKNVALASLSAGMSGAMIASIGLGLVGFGTAMGAGIAPAAAIAGFNSGRDLIKLSGEKKDLEELQKKLQSEGKAEVTKEVRQMQDGTWQEVEIPIDQRLEELQRSINGKKVILTASGSGLAALGATLIGGLSGWIAFPAAALVIGGVAAALFPEEAKALAKGAWKLIAGRFSKDARSERATKSQVKDDLKAFQKQVKDLDARLKEADPTAHKLLTQALGQYAQSADAKGRQETVGNIAEALDIIGSKEPQDAQAWLGEFRQFDEKVTKAWKEHEVGVHMRSEQVKKTLAHPSLPDRLQERGANPEELEKAYEELFRLQNDPKALQTLQTQAQGGDPAAGAKMELLAIFGAAAIIASVSDELGEEFMTGAEKAVSDTHDKKEMMSLDTFNTVYDSAQKAAKGGEVPLEAVVGVLSSLAAVEGWDDQGVNVAASVAKLQKDFGKEWVAEATKVAEKAYKNGDLPGANQDFPKLLQGADGKAPDEILPQLVSQAIDTIAVLEGWLNPNPQAQPGGQQQAPAAPPVANQTPTEIPQEDPAVTAARRQMAEAVKDMAEIDPEATGKLLDSFEALQGRFAKPPKDAEEAAGMRRQAGEDFLAAQESLLEKAPEAMDRWIKGHDKIAAQRLDSSIDRDLMGRVLDADPVKLAAEKAGMDSSEVEGLYKKLSKAYANNNDFTELAPLLNEMDPESEKGKQKAVLMAIDQTLVAFSAQQQNDPSELKARVDEHIESVYAQDPNIQAAVDSPEFAQLAGQLEMKPEELQGALNTMFAAAVDKGLDQRLSEGFKAGDEETTKLVNAGRAALGLVRQKALQAQQAAAAANPELVAEQAKQTFESPVIQTALSLEQVNQQANAFGVDARALMDIQIRAELGDAADFLAIQNKAQSGDEHAQKQLTMLGTLTNAVRYVAANAQRGGPPAQQAPAEAPAAPETGDDGKESPGNPAVA